MLKFVLFILALFATSAVSAQECESITKGAVYGIADLIGEPWTFTWETSQSWDNDQGEWVTLDPSITHVLEVPGEAILFRFEDKSLFLYGADQAPGEKADNLSTIYTYGYGGMRGPYQAVRTIEGEVFLLDNERCEFVSWNLAN